MRLKSSLLILMVVFILGCATEQPPVDANGKSPEQVMVETYTQIINGNFDEAVKSFSDEYIEEFMTSKNITFEEYCKLAEGWKVEWLKTELVGNDYNKDLWRVRIIPDEGKGKNNGPGIVQDLYIIDGVWKIVFWNHYPKS